MASTWTIAAQNYGDVKSIAEGCAAAARGDLGDRVGVHLAALKVATAWACDGLDRLGRSALDELHAQICAFHRRQSAKNGRALIAAASAACEAADALGAA